VVVHTDRMTDAARRDFTRDASGSTLRRLTALRRPQDRDSVLAAHVTLRRLVARITGRRTADVVIDRACVRCGGDEHGRPLVRESPGCFVSLAHADGLAVVALAEGVPVGVDAEPWRGASSWADISPRVFSAAERHALSGDDPRLGTRLWSRKEAVVKCAGVGLVDNLNTVDVLLGSPATGWSGGPYRAWVTDIPSDGHAVAVATTVAAPDLQVTVAT